MKQIEQIFAGDFQVERSLDVWAESGWKVRFLDEKMEEGPSSENS